MPIGNLDALKNKTDEDIIIEEAPEEKHDGLRHIIRPADNPHIWNMNRNMGGEEIVDAARVRRIEIVALCGYRFVPTRDPKDLDETCDPCLAMASTIMNEDG